MSGLTLATWPDDRARHGLPFSAGAADEHLVVPGDVTHGPDAGGQRGRSVVRFRDRYTVGLLTLNRAAISVTL